MNSLDSANFCDKRLTPVVAPRIKARSGFTVRLNTLRRIKRLG